MTTFGRSGRGVKRTTIARAFKETKRIHKRTRVGETRHGTACGRGRWLNSSWDDADVTCAHCKRKEAP